VYLAAVGTVHFQHCLPGCAQTLHIRFNASRRLLIGFGADEEKRGHDGAPWLVQAGARRVSQPPTPGAVPLPMMVELYSRAIPGTPDSLIPTRRLPRRISPTPRSPLMAVLQVARGTCLLKRDSNGLTAAFDLSGLAPWTALQLAMLELMPPGCTRTSRLALALLLIRAAPLRAEKMRQGRRRKSHERLK
jgi:hypothetical protein